MSRLSRQEMRRDEFREFLSRTFVWLNDHLRQIGIALVALAVVVLAWSLLSSRLVGRHDQASDDLAAAIETLDAPLASELSPGVAPTEGTYADAGERRQEALRRFQSVAEEYPRSSSARIARAYLATLDYEQGDAEAARKAWDELVSSGDDDALTVQALLNLLTVDRAQGRAAEAETRLLALVDNPRSPLPQPNVLYELALTQETLGKSEESRTTYQRLVDEHPQSPLARSAASKLASAGGAA